MPTYRKPTTILTVEESGGTKTIHARRRSDFAVSVADYGALGDGSTDDASAIQAAIDVTHALGGGVVYFPEGVYTIAATLVLKSNVHLSISPGATLKQTGDYITIATEAYTKIYGYHATPNQQPPIASGAVEVTSLTAAGRTVSATTAVAHGLSVGDWVVVTQGGIDYYNGTYRVETVPSTTQFTYKAIQYPSKTTCTPDVHAVDSKMYCCAATVNIGIYGGGTIDHNNKGTGGTLNTMCVMAYGALHTYVANLNVLNVSKYGFYGICLADAAFENLFFDTPSNALQFEGANRHVRIQGVHGYCGDDGVALLPKDDPAVYIYVVIGFGDIEDVVVRDIDIHSTTSTVALYNYGSARPAWLATTSYSVGDFMQMPSDTGYVYEATVGGTSGGSAPTGPTRIGDTVTDGSVTWTCRAKATFKMRSIVIDGVSGHSDTALIKMLGQATNISSIDDVTLKNIHGHVSSYALLVKNVTCEQLTIDGLSWLSDDPNDATASIGLLLQDSYLPSIDLRDVRDVYERSTTGIFNLVQTVNCTLERLSVDGVRCRYPASTSRVLRLIFLDDVSLKEISLRKVHVEYGSSLIQATSSSTVDLIVLDEVICVNVDYPISIAIPVTIQCNSMYADHTWAGSGVINVNAGGVATFYGNMPVVGGAIPLLKDNGGTFHPKSPGIAVDIVNTGPVSNASGNICNNTNDGLSCGAGVVVANGTSWKNLHSGSTY